MLDYIGALGMACCACAVVPIHAPQASHADREAIDAAAADLGFSTQYLDSDQGAVTVDLRPRTDVDGRAQRKACKRHIESTTDTAVLRHEFGHADDPSNVMTPHAGHDADQLTKEQRQRMAAELAMLRACRGATQ
jgi:hypothetical protein